MSGYSIEKRLLSFNSPLGPNVLLPERFEGREGISQLFEFEVELLAEAGTEIDPVTLVGQKASLGVASLDVAGVRHIHGIIVSLERTGSDASFDVYRAHLAPTLWLLGLTCNCRVFQNKVVVDILKQVFQENSVTIENQTRGSYPTLEYCTQYNETDLAFVSRLMEQHGIFYFFKHQANSHTLILADNRTSYAGCPLVNKLDYAPQPKNSEEFYRSLVQEFTESATLVAGKHTEWDYNFRNYAAIKTSSQNSVSDFGRNNPQERYGYPNTASAMLHTTSASPDDLDTSFAEVMRDAEDVTGLVYRGTSNARTLASGFTFDLAKHTRGAWNRTYLITEVGHRAQQVPSYRAADKIKHVPYASTFKAIKSDVTFRTPQTTPKPRVWGPQTGKVVVPAGEDQYIDKFGRVCVQFFWDRARPSNHVDNTWVRVAQQWAGKGWGTYFWPRVDDEVIIGFLEGDPDNPIVMGSVYNGVNLPKYALPDQKTRSGILTRSTLSGSADNANELRFEDKKGNEQIYLHAEKDMDTSIEKDSRTSVGNEQHLSVKKNQYEQIGGDKHETLQGNHIEKVANNVDRGIGQNLAEKVGMNYSLQIGENQSNKVGMVYVLDSGQEVHIKGGMNVVIEAGMGLSLIGPGGFITIDPMGVTIQGNMVMINSGGAQLQGSPAQTQDPQSPTAPTAAEGAV